MTPEGFSKGILWYRAKPRGTFARALSIMKVLSAYAYLYRSGEFITRGRIQKLTRLTYSTITLVHEDPRFRILAGISRARITRDTREQKAVA